MGRMNREFGLTPQLAALTRAEAARPPRTRRLFAAGTIALAFVMGACSDDDGPKPAFTAEGQVTGQQGEAIGVQGLIEVECDKGDDSGQLALHFKAVANGLGREAVYADNLAPQTLGADCDEAIIALTRPEDIADQATREETLSTIDDINEEVMRVVWRQGVGAGDGNPQTAANWKQEIVDANCQRGGLEYQAESLDLSKEPAGLMTLVPCDP